jgi:biofilm PGA synthesis N-glycosyltransferase PgaC
MERLLLITPAWNEASHLERTARAIVAQSRRPDLWLIVDDGSDDHSPQILARLEREIDFLQVLPGPSQALEESDDRLAIAAEARAFNSALATVDLDSYDFIGKLDADIELGPDYFERLLGHFSDEPELGIAGGVLLEDDGNGWRLTKVPGYHVRGALKLYRRVTLERIGGIEERLGWDTIDETYARMYGYATRSLPELVARHHRPVATRGGALRGRARHGRCAYILCYPAWWVALRSPKVAGEKPVGASGLAFLYGYVRSALSPDQRVQDDRFKRFVHRELRGRLLPRWSFFQPRKANEIR